MRSVRELQRVGYGLAEVACSLTAVDRPDDLFEKRCVIGAPADELAQERTGGGIQVEGVAPEVVVAARSVRPLQLLALLVRDRVVRACAVAEREIAELLDVED